MLGQVSPPSQAWSEPRHLFQVCREWRRVDGQAGLDPGPQNDQGQPGARLQLLQLRTQMSDGSALWC